MPKHRKKTRVKPKPGHAKKPKIRLRSLVLWLLLPAFFGTIYWADQSGPTYREYEVTVVEKFPHDRKAYTQGFFYHAGFFYESTGLYGQSSLRKVDPDSGYVQQRHNLPSQYFGEGVTLCQGALFQLTWREGRVFVYDSDNLQPLREHALAGEGWGITYDGKHLVISDGSDQLRFVDPASFEVQKTLKVTHNERPVSRLNELEYIDGEIWANVYQTKDIVRIHPKTGILTGRIFLGQLPLIDDRHGLEDVLNGIAYDPKGKKLWVTGKRYAYVYEVALKRRPKRG